MSAFVCILDRSGASLDPRAVIRLAEPLESDGGTLSSICHGPLAMAVRRTDDASDRERNGPVTDPETGLVVAVAGRFSPVDADSAREKAGRAQGAHGCASSALDALVRRETGFLARVSGSFVVIAADPGRPWLSVARDHLGTLKVYYYLDRHWLIAASEPAAILRHRAVPNDLDERSAARFLGFRFSHDERSFFRHIKELPPAHELRVTAGKSRVEQYWRFQIQRGPRDLSRQEVLTGFRTLLRRSMADDMAGLEPDQVALSLSGGLDSTALAALAPRGVRARSWRFDDTPDCDERGNIEAVAEHLEKPIVWVNGDGLYPLCGDYVDRFVHDGSPYLNAFAALKHRLYGTARASGCRQMMVGDCGDTLYLARGYWLRDTLTSGRPGALASLTGTIREATRGDRFARQSLRRLLPVEGVRNALGRRPLPWLTDAAHSWLPEQSLSPILPDVRRRHRYDLSVGAKNTELVSEETGRLSAQCGIGLSNPFWNWPLLEMVINLPAWWYHDVGGSKVLTREAMRGLLPQSVLESGRVGLLGSFFLRGIKSRSTELRETVFRRPQSDWQQYVRRSWLEPYLDATGSIEFGHTILWRVISYELWHRRLIRSR